jgi:hypothetical protein
VSTRTAEATKSTEGLSSSDRLAISLYRSAECKLTRVWRLSLVAGSSSRQHDRFSSSPAVFVGANGIVERRQQETRGPVPWPWRRWTEAGMSMLYQVRSRKNENLGWRCRKFLRREKSGWTSTEDTL